MNKLKLSKFTYTKDQMKWIAMFLGTNGGKISVVLELMTDPSCGFPAHKDLLKTFQGAADYARLIEKVKRVCESGCSEFEKWDAEILEAYKTVRL